MDVWVERYTVRVVALDLYQGQLKDATCGNPIQSITCEPWDITDVIRPSEVRI